jgi:hypothetical protein
VAEFGIDVKIAPKGDGLKKIEDDLGKVEKKAKATGEAAGRHIAKGFDDAATAALRLMAAEQKAAAAAAAQAAAQEKLNRELAEEAMWDAKVAKAKHDLVWETRRQEEATKKAADAIGAYDRALKNTASTSIPQAKTGLEGLVGGWKNIALAVGGVGGGLAAVKMGLDLIVTGFEKSEVAARAAIAAWRSMDNSGPSAYVGSDARQGTRLVEAGNLLNEGLGQNATYSTIDMLPKEVAAAVRNTKLDNQEFRKIIRDHIRAKQAVARDIEETWKAGNAAASDRTAAYKQTDEWKAIEREAEARSKRDAAAAARRSAATKSRGGSGGPAVDRWELDVEGVQLAVAAVDRLTEAYFGLAGAAESWTAAVEATEEEQQAMLSTAEAFKDQMLGAWNAVTGAIEGTEEATEQVKTATLDWAKEMEQQLVGPVGNAIDGLLDGLVRWEMGWKEWGAAALQEIAKVMARLLLLQGVQAAFGAGGGSSGLGQLLWGALGGAAPGGGGGGGGTSQRVAPGDPFGGAGGSSAPIVTERVALGGNRAGGQSGGGQTINVKVVNVSDPRAAAMEALQTQEAERLIVNTINNNRGALGLQGR